MELETIKKLTKKGEQSLSEFDTKHLVPFVWIPEFISICGSVLYEREKGREPEDLDIIVKADAEEGKLKIELDSSLRLKIDRILAKQFGDKSHDWHGTRYGANWRYQPLWDLVLIPHGEGGVREINEPEFSRQYYKEGRHSRFECMKCSDKPEYEILWAEGIGHAWFCKKHLKKWIEDQMGDAEKEGYSTDVVDALKEVQNDEASKKFNENTNPNIVGDLEEILKSVEFEKAFINFDKLNLEQFKQTGIDDELKNPKEKYKELFAGLEYLGNAGYPRLKEKKEWGEWKLDDILKYAAGIIDILRSKVYFPIVPPKIGESKYDTSYWEMYRKAKKYMKTVPPKENEIQEWDSKREAVIGKIGFKKHIPIFDISKSEDEHIVCGIVYPPDEVDTQGDFANAEEIKKACYHFMEHVRKFKVGHKTDFDKVAILENYVAPVDFELNKQLVKKGSWVLVLRILDEGVWKMIKSGEITGFSMGGAADRIAS